MTRLTVFYDARCGLCCAVREWISRQRQLVPIDFRAAAKESTDELTVRADSGETWTGDSAWLMVLWALSSYRAWSYRLASPLLRPLARGMFANVSAWRGSLSCSLGLKPEVDRT